MELLSAIHRVPADTVAVDFEGTFTRYGDLRERMAAVESWVTRGGGPGTRVAILMPHGHAEPAALLGVWAAGGIAVPLDLHDPLDRVRMILGRCSAQLLISQGPRGAALARRLGGSWESRTALVDAPEAWRGEGLEGGPPTESASTYGGEKPCIILFTSGSSGEPKGVTLTRGNVDTFVSHWRAEAALTRDDRVARCAALSFDLSLFDIGATLSAGATLVPVPEGVLAFPGGLGEWATTRSITVWYSVPSLAMELARSTRRPDELRVVLYAGEAMGADDARLLLERLPQVRLLNLFGPTETNVCCAYEVPRGFSGDQVPIGAACPYLEIRIVDETGRERPRGELLAAGGTVMHGYWGQPGRARWSELDGVRFLHTGDRVERGADGLLWFLGRLDRMVKIRGHRVEPGAVEVALTRIGGVGEAAAVVGVSGGVRTLVSYVSPAVGEPAPEPHELLESLAGSLPSFAVPERIIVLHRLPRNERGKVDYRKLESEAEKSSDDVALDLGRPRKKGTGRCIP